jgi:hypothetical protein
MLPEKLKRMTTLFTIIIILFFTTLLTTTWDQAHAHFIGTTKNVAGYQIVFQSTPRFVSAGQNTKLNFSILDKNSSNNINGIYVALIIKEKQSGIVVDQIPYKFYEFSDISISHTFQNNTEYIVTLVARINDGDQKYFTRSVAADFDVSVGPITIVQPSDLIATVTPVSMVLVGGIIFIFKKNT